VGTAALGAGIFLAGQIFHLQEHWPGGFLLWALGAWMGWLLLRDWLQLALAALLTPVWLLGEWTVATELSHGSQLVTAQAMLLLAMTYLTSLQPGRKTWLRISLTWVGGLALIPCTLFLVADVRFRTVYVDLPLGLGILGWSLAYSVPLALAYVLRGKTAWMNLIGAGWVLLMALPQPYSWTPYVLCAAFSVFLIWWGFQDERRERVNLGVAGFALTLLAFYFSSIMDKLDRALSLIILGVLFLALGWAMTRLRGYLMERFEERLS
jgi:uncharacterized membrane protein